MPFIPAIKSRLSLQLKTVRNRNRWRFHAISIYSLNQFRAYNYNSDTISCGLLQKKNKILLKSDRYGKFIAKLKLKRIDSIYVVTS